MSSILLPRESTRVIPRSLQLSLPEGIGDEAVMMQWYKIVKKREHIKTGPDTLPYILIIN